MCNDMCKEENSKRQGLMEVMKRHDKGSGEKGSLQLASDIRHIYDIIVT